MKKILFAFLYFLTANILVSGQSPISKPALDSLLKEAELTQTDGLVIFKDGKLFGEYYFGKEPKKIEAMSSTKSIVNFAIGKLFTDGLLDSLEKPVFHFYPEWNQGLKKEITVRELLNQTSGMQNVPNTNVEIYPSPDFVKLALAAEIVDTPGTRFNYNNKAVNLLSGIVQRISHVKLDNYLSEKIFKPLGIEDYNWTRDDEGNPEAMSGFQVFPKDMAKLGQLFLNRGKWNGQQLIADSWFTQTEQPVKLNPDYGLLWWIQYDSIFNIIDDFQIKKLKEIGFDKEMLEKIESIKGKYLSSDYMGFITDKVLNTTSDWVSKYVPLLVSNGMSLSRREYGKIIGYYTDGFLGNYMVIYPEKKLVVVRMISWDSFKKGKGNENGTGYNTFDNFLDLARMLVR
ncbi:MAG: serine hydrolase [Chitinophagaceae bacterium]|jgi:CubicO group peptidase (beta-lactamase class C family)|nr:serine hydrolase [Chitinophagaceae bacterium]OQY92407.1 MAG: hypothetical protein B6D37_14030 [Sphingobacteriales bacterium UTBCD1]